MNTKVTIIIETKKATKYLNPSLTSCASVFLHEKFLVNNKETD